MFIAFYIFFKNYTEVLEYLKNIIEIIEFAIFCKYTVKYLAKQQSYVF